MRCIAKDFVGRPLDREVVEVRGSRGYIIKPSVCITGEELETVGVAFPLNDLFEHDSVTMDDLLAAAESDSGALERAWSKAKPLVLRGGDKGDETQELC